jgi:hypothetical protein
MRQALLRTTAIILVLFVLVSAALSAIQTHRNGELLDSIFCVMLILPEERTRENVEACR